MFELRLSCAPELSVRTRVINALLEFPASVRELEIAGCGSVRSIRRALKELREGGNVVRIGRDGRSHRYGFRKGIGYRVLGEDGNEVKEPLIRLE